MKQLGLVVVLLGVLFGASAVMAAPLPKVMSGGIGEDELQALQAAQKEYTAKFVFSGENGIYLSDVDVVIEDAQGAQVVHVVTQGPILLVDVPQGEYTLTALVEGHEKQLRFTLKDKTLATYQLRFPVSE